MTLDDIRNRTLGEVSDLLRAGKITPEVAREYVALWNEGPHFTAARVEGWTICQYDR
jgi:hypothetical protein